ncbi:alpha/beta hydrolase [Amycolatopsis sp. NPDC023774]|uniref:alpha/beta hydrolase n=1 Tax=Amycolatopsis sp. NPDC023774 TaxID=3155015 RepID=UPI0033F7B726
MVSAKAQLYMAYLRATRQKRFYDDARTLHHRLHRHQRPSMARPPRQVRRACAVERWEARGRPCWTLRPRRGATSDLHVVHLHGGGYVEEIESHHWRYAADLVARLGCAVTLPIYPLVPRHDHTETLPMVYAAYDHIADHHPAERLVISGDSAGGALALAIAQNLREQARPQPARLLLYSPWLDITLEDPISVVLDEHDPMLGITGLREAGRMYAEGADPHDPRISPLHADLTGLGPFSLFIGTRDLLLPDARRFTARARDAEIDVDYAEYPGMFHNWLMQTIPEGREAMNHVERILRRPTGKSGD